MDDGPPSPLHNAVCRRLPAHGSRSAAAERRRRLVRRSDPGLSVAYDEMLTIGSGWDVTTSATTSCGLGRSSSLRNSFLLGRTREPLWIQNVRQQLNDQLKCLDVRLESHVTMLGELQDFYRRRSEVELEYSRGIDKLVKQIMARHKTDKQKRELWPGYSTYTIWQTLLGTTRRLGRDHAVLAELYSTQISNRLTELVDDVQRIYKKCHEMALSSHEEIVKALSELQNSMKTYQLYHGEFLQAENKLRHAENQRIKVEQQQNAGGVVAAKTAISRRFRNYEKLSEKKHVKYLESRLKAVKARNEYILCLEAANAAMQKYFNDDMHDLINMMDYGYHCHLNRTIQIHTSADDSMLKSSQGCLDLLNQRVRDLDQRCDKQTFLELHGQPFTLPKLFELQPHRGDEMMQVAADKFVQDELVDRLNSINERLNTLRVESDEAWKTLEMTDKTLMEMVVGKECDIAQLFQEEWQPPKSPLERDKRRGGRLETEEFYLMKFHHYQTLSNLTARLQAKYNCIEKALSDSGNVELANIRFSRLPSKSKRRKVFGRAPVTGRPRLFGGVIEEYVEATGEQIPLIVRSCIRMINLYGMHHQGVFRVSGSQHEINEFRNLFEQGKDPLPDKVDGKDINSVAGVLKLYFRELKEPLFPSQIFDDLISCCCQHNFNNMQETENGINHLHSILSTLPQAVVVVMRYLFAFLNHLSEFSDENMMDPYNLAICFGPTLLPVPSDREQVQFQSHIIEIVRSIIAHQDELFSRLDPTPDSTTLYERCIVENHSCIEDCVDNLSDDGEVVTDIPSEDECDVKEAVALYDFRARTRRELSFHKGDTLMLYERVSSDWWEGTTSDDHDGLIPDKYVRLRHREASDSRSDDNGKRKSVESLPSNRNARLSVHPFDDGDELSPPHHSESSVETATYSSGSVIWKSSSIDVVDAETLPKEQPQGSATDSCGSELTVESAGGRRLSDRNMASSDSSDVLLSSDCSLSSDQSPTRHHAEHCDPQPVSNCAVVVSARVDSPVQQNVVTSACSVSDDASVACRNSVSERKTLPDEEKNTDCSHGNGSLLEEINSHLKQTDIGELLPTSVSEMSPSSAQRLSDDMSMLDIDTALAEVMSGIELLGRSRGVSLNHSSTETSRSPAGTSSVPSSPSARVTSPRTPDLVVGLPQNAGGAHLSTSPRQLAAARSPPSATGRLTSAETFANVDRCTIKKSSASTSAPSSAEIWTFSVHPLRAVGNPPPSAGCVSGGGGGGIVTMAESPVRREMGDSGKSRGSPARSQSCRAADRQSDQTWSALWTTSSDIQRDRELMRSGAPQFVDVARHPSPPSHCLSSPGRGDRIVLECADLPRFPPSSTTPEAGAWKDPSSSQTHTFVATLPRDAVGAPKFSAKVKPPVMKKPARSVEMTRRLNEYQNMQQQQQQLTDSTYSALPK